VAAARVPGPVTVKVALRPEASRATVPMGFGPVPAITVKEAPVRGATGSLKLATTVAVLAATSSALLAGAVKVTLGASWAMPSGGPRMGERCPVPLPHPSRPSSRVMDPAAQAELRLNVIIGLTSWTDGRNGLECPG